MTTHNEELEDEFESGHETKLDELEERLEALEDLAQDSWGSRGISLGYGLGMAIAVVLLWSRNAGIWYCIGHGLLSWGYVAYFAATR